MYEFNVEEDTWTKRNPCPVALWQHGCVAILFHGRQSIFCAKGRRSDNEASLAVVVYDIVNDTWTWLPDRGENVIQRPAMHVRDGRVYFLAGMDAELGQQSMEVIRQVEYFDLEDEQWARPDELTVAGEASPERIVVFSHDVLLAK